MVWQFRFRANGESFASSRCIGRGSDGGARRRVPDADQMAVVSRGQARAVGGEVNGQNSGPAPHERQHRLAPCGVPEPDRPVDTRRRQRARHC